jgi:DNA ligase (NAD+)
VDPVVLSGASVTRVSLHNLSIMETLGGEEGLTLGSEVLMVRRGGVIPHVERVLKRGEEPVVIPTHCPFCGAATERRGDFLYADHAPTCQTMRVRQLEHYTKTIELKGMGTKILEQLFEAELGTKLAEKLIDQIDASRQLPAETFLCALGIDELGKHVSKILATRYQSIDEIFALTEEELASIHTIGTSIAQKVTQGLSARKEEIEALLTHITLSFGGQAGAGAGASGSGALAGKKVLFTGTLNAMPRNDAIKLVEAQGGTCPSSVSKDLDLLVIGDEDLEKYEGGWRSSKLKKAEQLIGQGAALRIIGETEFLKIAKAGSGDEAESGEAAADQLSLI